MQGKGVFLGCGPALHDVETTRRCIVASLRPEMFDAAGRAACRVGTCGVSGGVSGLSVWLVAGRAACRILSKVGFF